MYAKFKCDVSFGDKNNPEQFIYEKDKKYECIDINDLPENYLVRQPNSPKNIDWWTKFDKKNAECFFEIVDDK